MSHVSIVETGGFKRCIWLLVCVGEILYQANGITAFYLVMNIFNKQHHD